MAGFSKLYSGLVTSSIWVKDNATLRVWIAMLATCDAHGFVAGSVPGFASLARVSIEEMRHAVDTLSSPDVDSRSKEHEGRRIAAIEGGWLILNYEKYRSLKQDKDGSRAKYYRDYRERNK